MPTQVKIDNNTSDRFTIIDVFTFDRPGLLYAIAKTLYDVGLSVGVARIGTYLDQVVDVFYVTDERTGAKITDEARREEIRQRLPRRSSRSPRYRSDGLSDAMCLRHWRSKASSLMPASFSNRAIGSDASFVSGAT